MLYQMDSGYMSPLTLINAVAILRSNGIGLTIIQAVWCHHDFINILLTCNYLAFDFVELMWTQAFHLFILSLHPKTIKEAFVSVSASNHWRPGIFSCSICHQKHTLSFEKVRFLLKLKLGDSTVDKRIYSLLAPAD